MNQSPDVEVSSLAELLAATGCGGVEDLAEAIDARWDIDAPDVVDLRVDDSGLDVVGLYRDGERVSYPFTLEEFWEVVDDVGDRAARRYEVRTLPGAFMDATPTEILDGLADMLDVSPAELLAAVGGGWVELVEPVVALEVDDPDDTRWYAAGAPLQLLLAVTPDEVLVAEPVAVPGGLAGPPRLETGELVAVPVDAPEVLSELRDAVAAVSEEVAARHGVCHGCRTFQALTAEPVSGGRWCSACVETYLGVIVD